MSTSPVEIFNSALIKIGAPPITSFTDNNKAARLGLAQYNRLRKEVLRQHPWKFALTRMILVPSIVIPAFDWGRQFELPADCLRVWRSDDYQEWSVETTTDNKRVILCNDATINMRYIRDVQDTTIMTSDFEEVLAWRIAKDIAYSLVQSSTLRNDMAREYEMALRLARSISAQESSGPETFDTGSWLDVRF